MTQVDEVSAKPYEMPYVLAEPKVEEVKADEETRNSDDTNRVDNSSGHVFEVTAFTSGAESTGKHPNDPAYGITASGARVRANHTIACSPEIPFGTQVDIKGIGVRTCEDRGSKIVGKRLDVYMESVEEAIKFGRRQIIVEVME